MIVVWILSYLAVFMLGMASLVAYFSFLDHVEKKRYAKASVLDNEGDWRARPIIKPQAVGTHPSER